MDENQDLKDQNSILKMRLKDEDTTVSKTKVNRRVPRRLKLRARSEL